MPTKTARRTPGDQPLESSDSLATATLPPMPKDVAEYTARRDAAWRMLATLGGDPQRVSQDVKRYLCEWLPCQPYQVDDYIRDFGRVPALQQQAGTPDERQAAREALSSAVAEYRRVAAEVDEQIAALERRKSEAAEPVEQARQVVDVHANAVGELRSRLPEHVRQRIRETVGRLRDSFAGKIHEARYRKQFLESKLALDLGKAADREQARELLVRRFGRDARTFNQETRQYELIHGGPQAVAVDGSFDLATWDQLCGEMRAELATVSQQVQRLETDQAGAMAAEQDAETKELQNFWLTG